VGRAKPGPATPPGEPLWAPGSALTNTGPTLSWSPDSIALAFVYATAGPEPADATGGPILITRFLYKPTASEGNRRRPRRCEPRRPAPSLAPHLREAVGLPARELPQPDPVPESRLTGPCAVRQPPRTRTARSDCGAPTHDRRRSMDRVFVVRRPNVAVERPRSFGGPLQPLVRQLSLHSDSLRSRRGTPEETFCSPGLISESFIPFLQKGRLVVLQQSLNPSQLNSGYGGDAAGRVNMVTTPEHHAPNAFPPLDRHDRPQPADRRVQLASGRGDVTRLIDPVATLSRGPRRRPSSMRCRSSRRWTWR